ncbi:hypothetical protein TYRP_020733 [Tyrophagus putrescentiae]|nr:hypothetical protein TYRP_020733 [Tyrophagus putrescentiae]
MATFSPCTGSSPDDFTDSATYCQTRKPIIVQHGLVSSSSNFFITSKELTSGESKYGDNFGFSLLLTGRYDVWVPNLRGNGVSMKHTTYSTWNPKFWKFSFQQMAQFDMPAVIDYIREETGCQQMGYVGHSQGCAVMFALLCDRPEYGALIRPFISWAPAVFLQNMRSSMTVMSRALPLFHRLGGQFAPTHHIANWIGGTACRTKRTKVLVTKELEKINGPTDQMNPDRLPVYFHFWPMPSSMWQLVHFGQLYQTGKFVKFDYGSASLNRLHYDGAETPPEYDFDRIPDDMHIIIMNGNSDYLVTPENVEHLVDLLKPKLKNLQHIKVDAEQFNHNDFLFGKDAGVLVYDKTIELLDKLV